MRRGISLLEVLISMFVLLVGLLGVMSLLPAGRSEVMRGAKIDRASACGRAAFRDMRIRGMLDPQSYALANASGSPAFSGPDPSNAGQYLFHWDPANPATSTNFFQSFVIDPLGVGANFGRWFPYDTSASPTVVHLPRLTLGPGLTSDVRAAIAETIFHAQDDLAFDSSGGNTKLPIQVFDKDTTGTPQKRQAAGDYSWLATINSDTSTVRSTSVFDSSMTLSIAVFYKRDIASATGVGERVCELVSLGTDIQDEVQLKVTTVAPQYSGAGEGVAHLGVKPNQWIMLAANSGTVIGPIWNFAWHRVAAADSVLDSTGKAKTVKNPGTGPWTRNVTLIGPFTGPGSSYPASMVVPYLFDGVIAVYEKTIKLERDSVY